jgi:hypothetical protein
VVPSVQIADDLERALERFECAGDGVLTLLVVVRLRRSEELVGVEELFVRTLEPRVGQEE